MHSTGPVATSFLCPVTQVKGHVSRHPYHPPGCSLRIFTIRNEAHVSLGSPQGLSGTPLAPNHWCARKVGTEGKKSCLGDGGRD